MNTDVFRAILAMDSYNRGYGRGLNGVDGSQIGAATVGPDSSILTDASGERLDLAAGFYASTYSWNGRTVISYHGTNPETAVSIGRDIWSGWRLGAAIPFGGQPELATAQPAFSQSSSAPKLPSPCRCNFE